MNTLQSATEAVRLAKQYEANASMRSSAELLRQDAEVALKRGEFDLAVVNAARSLKYSLGVFNPTFQQVEAMVSEGWYV